ncbi:ABC transporter permease, partial [Mesorhizobium sp. M4B.F.Ca.ET.215.01.1.1]
MSALEPTTPAAEKRAGWAWRPYARTLPALVLLAAVIGYPLLTIVLRSLSEPQWGVQNYA